MAEESYDTSLMVWNEKTIGDITGASLLSVADIEKLKQCAPAITHAFHHVQIYRTRTEMEISVLSDVHFPTPDAKYWQTVREMNVFIEQLIELGFNYREKMLDLESLEEPEKEPLSRIDRERRSIAIERKKFEIQCIQRDAHHRIREIDEWRQIQDYLIPQLKAGTEEVNNHQLISYTIQFMKQWKLITEGGVSLSQGEKQNLQGHIQTSLRVIKEKGLLDVMLKAISDDTELVKFLYKNRVIERAK